MHTFGILFSVHLHLHHPYIHKYKNHFNEMKGDVGMADQQETRHGLESNPVPTTSFFILLPLIALLGVKTGCRDRVRL